MTVQRHEVVDRWMKGGVAEYVVGSPQATPLRGVVGSSLYARTLRKQMLQLQRDRRNVFMFGEPGLYKDEFASLIHFGAVSRDRQAGLEAGPLLFLECGQVSARGRRVFGRPGRPGLLDRAEKGTLLINNLQRANTQLRQEVAELMATGSYVSRADGQRRHSRLRVIAVSDEDCKELEDIPSDLVMKVKVPPVRVRPQDIRSLVAFELRRRSQLSGRPVPTVEEAALKRLEAYDFPGNVAELFAVVDRALLDLPDEGALTAELFWQAQNIKKLDGFRVSLFDAFPSLREFVLSDMWPEQINHGFTKYAFVVFNVLLFVGPQTRDMNFGLNLFWDWWWPGILLAYPIIGRLWCAVCPFMIWGEVVQRWRVSTGAVLLKWPTDLLTKYGYWFLFWLFAAILVWEECWDLRNTAYLSSCLLLLITAGAMVCSWFFERRMWCRYLCPIGGMNGLFAKLSLTELRAQRVCKARCTSANCYKGGLAEGEGQQTGGCPLYTHPANLVDNRDCTFCMTCVKACPHESPQLNLRAPGLDFGYPFLFPLPGTEGAQTHSASAHEVALMFLLLGAVVCHHLPELLRQLHVEDSVAAALLEDRAAACLAAAAALAAPGLLAWGADAAMRAAGRAYAPEEQPPQGFVELAYCYLPLVWLANLAHYLLPAMTEAGLVLPVAARSLGFLAAHLGVPGEQLRAGLASVEGSLPTLTTGADVAAFVQGATLLLGAGISSLMLVKLGEQRRFIWFYQLSICAMTFELFQLIV